MKTRIEWKDGMSFLAESGSGHSVLMDGPPEAGGKNLGPRGNPPPRRAIRLGGKRAAAAGSIIGGREQLRPNVAASASEWIARGSDHHSLALAATLVAVPN